MTALKEKCSPHGWTVDTLETHLTSRIDTLEKTTALIIAEREDRSQERFRGLKSAIDSALAASDRAISKAENATEKRFDSVNEFRAALADQAATLMPRAEYLVQHGALISRADINSKRIEQLQEAITSLESVYRGRSSGFGTSGAIIMGLVAGTVALVSIVGLILQLVRH